MDSTLIRTRLDLARHLQAQMVAARLPWGPDADEGEAAGRTQVKTYLLEAHRHAAEAGALATLHRVADPLGLHVHETDDPDLLRVWADGTDSWCDTSMGRFWRLHTVAKVDAADALRDRLVRSSPWLDNVWLPPIALERLAQRAQAQMQVFSLSHDRRPLHADNVEGRDFDNVTLRLWSSKAQETLAKLRGADVFPHGVSVRSVRLRSGSPEPDGDFCVAEYFHNGKVTAGGTSFDEHTRVLVNVLRDYRKTVEQIEERYGIGYVDDGHGHSHLAGDPVVIDVEWTVEDLEFAVRRMFDSVGPFRLWGLPERLGEGYYRTHAVDLHVGSTLTFDITRDRITVLLPRGTCGNTIVRFLGSLRYHVDSEAGSIFN